MYQSYQYNFVMCARSIFFFHQDQSLIFYILIIVVNYHLKAMKLIKLFQKTLKNSGKKCCLVPKFF